MTLNSDHIAADTLESVDSGAISVNGREATDVIGSVNERAAARGQGYVSEQDNQLTERHHILIVAYACGPGRGSEESVGWDTADALARRGFKVTVLTRTSERNTCPPASKRHPNLNLVCHDISNRWRARFDGLGKLGVEFGYLMWLLSAGNVISSLHRQTPFTTAQHVTYARYWMPSPLRVLDIPWILGPVGGGESIPAGLRSTLSRSGRVFEWVRDAMRLAGEHSPAVRQAARSCELALANTKETASRLNHIGARKVEIMNSAALSDAEFESLSSRVGPTSQTERSGFVSIGRLLDWKGFHLGLQAFAQSGLNDEIYTIIGTGPFESRLQQMAKELGVDDRVRFTGAIPRTDVFEVLSSARALIHPSLHESGGFVCLEAMAAKTPVICVDTGGPGLFVTKESGIAVSAGSHAETLSELAHAMQRVTGQLSESMGAAASNHVRRHHTMHVKSDRLAALHVSMAGTDIESGIPRNATSSNRSQDREPEAHSLPVTDAGIAASQ